MTGPGVAGDVVWDLGQGVDAFDFVRVARCGVGDDVTVDERGAVGGFVLQAGVVTEGLRYVVAVDVAEPPTNGGRAVSVFDRWQGGHVVIGGHCAVVHELEFARKGVEVQQVLVNAAAHRTRLEPVLEGLVRRRCRERNILGWGLRRRWGANGEPAGVGEAVRDIEVSIEGHRDGVVVCGGVDLLVDEGHRQGDRDRFARCDRVEDVVDVDSAVHAVVAGFSESDSPIHARRATGVTLAECVGLVGQCVVEGDVGHCFGALVRNGDCELVRRAIEHEEVVGVLVDRNGEAERCHGDVARWAAAARLVGTRLRADGSVAFENDIVLEVGERGVGVLPVAVGDRLRVDFGVKDDHDPVGGVFEDALTAIEVAVFPDLVEFGIVLNEVPHEGFAVFVDLLGVYTAGRGCGRDVGVAKRNRLVAGAGVGFAKYVEVTVDDARRSGLVAKAVRQAVGEFEVFEQVHLRDVEVDNPAVVLGWVDNEWFGPSGVDDRAANGSSTSERPLPLMMVAVLLDAVAEPEAVAEGDRVSLCEVCECRNFVGRRFQNVGAGVVSYPRVLDRTVVVESVGGERERVHHGVWTSEADFAGGGVF